MTHNLWTIHAESMLVMQQINHKTRQLQNVNKHLQISKCRSVADRRKLSSRIHVRTRDVAALAAHHPLLLPTPRRPPWRWGSPHGSKSHPEVRVPPHRTHTVTLSGCCLHPPPPSPGEAAWAGAVEPWGHQGFYWCSVPTPSTLSSDTCILCFIYTNFQVNFLFQECVCLSLVII